MKDNSRKKSPIQYVVIGNSAAGIAAVREIRRYDPMGRITVVSDEPIYGYSRVMLPLYIAGKRSRREMVIAPRAFYASQKIRLLRGETVEAVDPGDQRVFTRNGASLPYDRLLIATGASPRMLDLPGRDLQGIHHLRKMIDAEAIRLDLASSGGPVLVVGGGLVSIKCVEALLSRKKEIHLVVSSGRIFSQMLDEAASDFLLKALQSHGVKVRFHADVRAFEGKKRIKGALLSDGATIPCGLAIVGKGVRPNIDSLAGTGIAMEEGVLVDDRMATSLPSVYAAGDVAEPVDVLKKKNVGNATWPLAGEGGRIAGSNMASVPAVHGGALRMNSMEVLGTRVVSAGETEGEEPVQSLRKGGAVYRKLIFEENRLRGFILVGDIRGAGILTSLIRNQTEVSSSALEGGLERGFSFSPRLQGLGGCMEANEYKGRQA
jgi:nitrite reductase (NADH) large subunit